MKQLNRTNKRCQHDTVCVKIRKMFARFFFFGRRPLPFVGSHLRLPSGPAGIRTTTGSLSALARPTPYQLSHRVASKDVCTQVHFKAIIFSKDRQLVPSLINLQENIFQQCLCVSAVWCKCSWCLVAQKKFTKELAMCGFRIVVVNTKSTSITVWIGLPLSKHT